VEEAVAAEAEVDKGGLDGRFNVSDFAFVDITDVGGGAGALHIELFRAGRLRRGRFGILRPSETLISISFAMRC